MHANSLFQAYFVSAYFSMVIPAIMALLVGLVAFHTFP